MHGFIPDLPVLAGFVIASIVLGLTPGPDMTLFLSKTVSHSRQAGFAAASGALSGVIVHTVLVAVGLSALLAASTTAFTILKIVGALYLAWLAYDAIRNGSALSLNRQGGQERLASVYWKGVLVDLLNPKVIVFFVTFLPQFVSASDPAAAEKMLFVGFYFVALNIPLLMLLVLGARKLTATLKARPRILRVIDYVFAGVFGAFAVTILRAQSR
jgi:threonine/homoserine/homoserine lactone efflux protein